MLAMLATRAALTIVVTFLAVPRRGRRLARLRSAQEKQSFRRAY